MRLVPLCWILLMETESSPPDPPTPPPLYHYHYQVMGGRSSSSFQDYHTLCVQALTEIRKHAEAVIILMEIMTHKSSFPAFRSVRGAYLEEEERGFRGVGGREGRGREGKRDGVRGEKVHYPSSALCGKISSNLVHCQCMFLSSSHSHYRPHLSSYSSYTLHIRTAQ
jgi:hypothetical protein